METLFEVMSYNTDPDLRAVTPPCRTFVLAADAERALRKVCEVLGVAEPGMVQLSAFKGARPADAVVLN